MKFKSSKNKLGYTSIIELLYNFSPQIYLTAGNVYNLENRVQTLADKVKAVNALSEQDKMEKLENQVASTVAKVAHSEKEVRNTFF